MRVAVEQRAVEGPAVGPGTLTFTTACFLARTLRHARRHARPPRTALGKHCGFLLCLCLFRTLSVAVLTAALSLQRCPPHFSTALKCISVLKFSENLFVGFILNCFLVMTKRPLSLISKLFSCDSGWGVPSRKVSYQDLRCVSLAGLVFLKMELL